MSIEKSLYAAPQGLAGIDQEPDIEIEIEDPEALKVSIGGEEILDIEKPVAIKLRAQIKNN